jgi:competence protein ComEA
MQPSAPAPWRVLETPPAGDERRGNSGAPPRRSADDGDGQSMLPRMLVIVGLAAACSVGAFVLAVGGGDGAVRVDGGTRIDDVASVAPGGSAGAEVVGQGSELVVEIVGAVRRPGVYRMPAGSRVGDLVEAAGGYGPRVDTAGAERSLNLAARVQDGDQVRVPSRDDRALASLASGAEASHASAGGAIDLNTATQAELEALPGVGPATAQKIIAAREEAPFGAVEELRSRGILGEKTFEKLRELVTVG